METDPGTVFGWFSPRKGFTTVALVLLIAAVALVFRGQRLDLRPFHGDEAVQAVKAGELYDSGHYQYNPFEFHGPSLYYFTLPVLKLSGARNLATASDASFRMVPVFFGTGLILLLLPLRRELGVVAVLTAAALLAVSPAMVFFSRYYIQELLLVFFAGLALCALWRYHRSQRTGWVVLLGMAAGLMYATKETSVISLGAMGAAYAWLTLSHHTRKIPPVQPPPRRMYYHLMLACGVAALVAFLLYSSFFDHPRGPLDSLLAFRYYFHRSGGDGSEALHRHPWYYYLKMLAYTKDAPGPWWSEGLILLLAAIGLIVTFCKRLPAAIHPDLAVFLAVYTLCMTTAYALIPYKTPWNMLGFLHGLILMAGIGAAAVFHHLSRMPSRTVWVLLLLAGAGHLAAQAMRANLRFCSDPRNPYVYAHAVPDVIRLSRRIHELSALHDPGNPMPVHVIAADYWPMPYYLRDLRQVGYWNEIPAAPDAPVMVVAAELQERLELQLRDSHHTEYFGLRPHVLLVLNVRQDLWDRYLQMKLKQDETSRTQTK